MTSDKISLELFERTATGKQAARLRKDGDIPGVVYGRDMDAINVQAPDNIVQKIVQRAGRHHPVYVTIGDLKKIVMIKDIDMDQVKNKILHLSMQAVSKNDKVETEVPIKLVGEGESPAEKAGLIVLQTLETIRIHALPMALPDALEVSITELAEPHEQLTVADIVLPTGVELDDAENVQSVVVASVYEPSALQAANESAGGDAEDEDEVESEHGEAGESDEDSEDTDSDPDSKDDDSKKE